MALFKERKIRLKIKDSKNFMNLRNYCRDHNEYADGYAPTLVMEN